MTGQRELLDTVLSEPDIVGATSKDPAVHAYHKWYPHTPVTQKYAVVVVKQLDDDAFILTAFFTSRIKKGTVIWQQ